jgi:hypothetical protein
MTRTSSTRWYRGYKLVYNFATRDWWVFHPSGSRVPSAFLTFEEAVAFIDGRTCFQERCGER